MSKYLYHLLLCLLALGATGCMSEDDVSQTTSVSQTKAEFKVLSVVSHQSGQAISLSLDLQQSGEDLRSVQAREESASGALDMVAVGATEQMHLYLYKEGDPASLSTATVTWQGRTETSIKLEKIDFRLAPGYSFRVGDNWLVAGVLGGKLDPQTGRIQMGTPRSASVANAFAKDAMVDMPYALAWQKLNIPRDNYGVIPQTTLQPMGTLLRLHFYNDLLEPYEASMLQLETNALRPTGTFDPTSDKSLGALPRWTAEEAESDTPKSWQYQLGGTHAELKLGAGAGYDAQRTLYLWAMPTAVSEEKTATKIQLDLSTADNAAETFRQTTYEKRGHRSLKGGHSYRLSNVLTSDLLITEVYYQFVKADKNLANTGQQNYSIVELYNPTASEIDLSDYALARMTYGGSAYGNQYVYAAQGVQEAMASLDPKRAQMLALSTVTGATDDLLGFSTMMGNNGGNDRYRALLGTATRKIKPGQTILLGADGYIGGIAEPGKTIADFNAALASNPNLADNPAAVRALEKPYYPRAGMQIDSAVRAGYAQFMVALDNSRYIKTAPSLTSGSGVLLMDNGDGFALFKRLYTSTEGRQMKLVDVTAPFGDASAAAAYRQKLKEEYNQASKTPITAIVTQDAIAYSVVRTDKSNFATGRYEAEDWRVAVSENDGVKSLGTRHYVAGLTPYEHNYSGYKQSNNPKGLPFWGNRRFTAPAPKQWGDILATGQNTFDDGITSVGTEFTSIPIASATATEEQAGYLIGKSYDKDLSTYYHSKNRADNPAFPITLTYHFAEPKTLSHVLFYPHTKNSSFGRTEISVVYEDGTQALVLDKDLGAPDTPTTITWPGIESRKIKSVSFRVHNTPYGVLGVKEMEFMTRNANYVDPTGIFADVLCTQLRPGITYAQIQAIPDPFYREMARQMHQGTYPREFRIAEYQSYPNPTEQERRNRIQFEYSRYDNPTGISVKKGETIRVWVDNTSGQAASLVVQDMYALPSYGNNYTTYPLKQGANVITPDRTGLLYLLYHSSDTERNTLPKLRMHIAGGRVNGYYDSQNPKHQGRWTELLSKAVDPHFDVMSQNVHLIYPTAKFRDLVRDPAPLLAMYEKFITAEWGLMGLVKYGRTFNNRMECRVTYDGYMYATRNRTGFNVGTMELLMNPERMRQEPWGLAHEMGHMNQTVGFNWGGMIEVTVNVFASYVQFVTLGNTFRGLQPNEDWFTRGWNRLLEKPGVTLSMMSKDGDPVTSMFQLELYLGQVRGKTPTKMADKGGFYPELFELLRQANASINNTTGDPAFNGNQQADFVYYASKAAGLDLTDFFERWGYLRPVDNAAFLNTYNNEFRITLTQQKVDEVKAKIRSLGLPKPGVAFEYITTRNMDMFRTPRPVVPGTATRDGQMLRFTDWQNVVAWEVVDGSGSLVYTSTGWHQDFSANVAGFSLPDNIPWQTSYRVRAISATGQRTVVAL